MGIVFNNLISNAVKHNQDGGLVEITLTRTSAEIRSQVRDTGTGLEPKDMDKLFGEFIRIKNEHTRKMEGSGLGLSTVKKLPRLYGGDVQVESRIGEGSLFTVVLTEVDASENNRN